MSFVTFIINDDGSRREVDRHEREDYARGDLRSWKQGNPTASFILVDGDTNKDIITYGDSS